MTRNQPSHLHRHITPLNRNIIRVTYTHGTDEPLKSVFVSDDFIPEERQLPDSCICSGNCLSFKNAKGETVLTETGRSLTDKAVYRYLTEGEPVIRKKQTANGEVTVIENAIQDPTGIAYEGKLTFSIGPEECFYGLGQHEEGIYNYHGKKEYLMQTNRKISIPFILSSKNYGLLMDTESALIFESTDGEITFTLDTVHELSYYIILGEDFEEILYALRALTGRAPMLPRWAFGYIQSKERYHSSEDLRETVRKFRESGIPIDCIVQDWFTWEEGLWGEKRVDKKRYPDVKGLVESLHKAHVRLMVSIWPNMAEGGSNLLEFKERGLLLPNTTTYNAFEEEARALYWKQCEEDWFSAGIDAWWCDNAEPFSDADWNGETKRPEEVRYQLIVDESRKFMDWTRLNSYGLYHAKGIYDNWRKTCNGKRVVNLTRSATTSGQRYGVVLWSGDTSAKWSTLRKQITEGIKIAMSGMPYWTLDIGAFFTVKDKWENRGCNCSGNSNKLWFWDGDYNDGVKDPGYKELYVRWLQFAAFLPLFRAHGTDTPREPWHFGPPGDPFYEAILKFIKLRYQLLPYIYALAAEVYRNHATMMCSLMFDFSEDVNVRKISDSFMFGKAFLVSPVTEPMYYEANGVPIDRAEKVRKVYLPKGSIWFDFWTKACYEGGQTVTCKASLDTMPLFVRGGSIVPLSEPLQYADERNGEIAEILIYSGRDGAFTLYNDAGDDYSYETDHFSAIPVSYRDGDQTLTFGSASGSFKYQEHFKLRLIAKDGTERTSEFAYNGLEETVRFTDS